ncbi:hypothetical protein NAI75_09355, partial [Francisella tularensis subsp. holarctica]|nr:hypothetical protein [Francisella tularensis subsp. holarctica]
VLFVGIRKDLGFNFNFSSNTYPMITLKDAICDLRESVIPALPLNNTNGDVCKVTNHEVVFHLFICLGIE